MKGDTVIIEYMAIEKTHVEFFDNPWFDTSAFYSLNMGKYFDLFSAYEKSKSELKDTSLGTGFRMYYI